MSGLNSRQQEAQELYLPELHRLLTERNSGRPASEQVNVLSLDELQARARGQVKDTMEPQ
jgi:hypothetical protein